MDRCSELETKALRSTIILKSSEFLAGFLWQIERTGLDNPRYKTLWTMITLLWSKVLTSWIFSRFSLVDWMDKSCLSTMQSLVNIEIMMMMMLLWSKVLKGWIFGRFSLADWMDKSCPSTIQSLVNIEIMKMIMLLWSKLLKGWIFSRFSLVDWMDKSCPSTIQSLVNIEIMLLWSQILIFDTCPFTHFALLFPVVCFSFEFGQTL